MVGGESLGWPYSFGELFPLRVRPAVEVPAVAVAELYVFETENAPR